jgi:hypothetical protein
MAFSEEVKLAVKKMAAFRCCRCQSIGVEIHHIVPQKVSGPDTIDNAAPLCAKCHGDFGDNPIKKKEITQMRDWWYEIVNRTHSSSGNEINTIAQRIDSLVLITKESSDQIEELKSALKDHVALVIDKITPQNVQATATSIVNMIPLDTGYSVNHNDIAVEGYCQCERDKCVESNAKMYCYWPRWFPEWVIRTGLYYKCYDEIVNCPRCKKEHKRGLIGKLGVCENPFINQ